MAVPNLGYVTPLRSRAPIGHMYGSSVYNISYALIEQFLPTKAHRHIMSIVYFINSFPQYVFRRVYVAIFRGSLRLLT
jgi:hypothetical protein